jgi:hypothetical protein
MDVFTKDRSHRRTRFANHQTENPVKKLKFLLLFFTLLFPLTACAQLFAQSGTRPAVYVQYHVWFRTADQCPTSSPTTTWYHWAWWSESNNPCNFVGGTSWLRDYSGPTYPLIGPYKSNNPEIFRWHIRLAKAAGIDGFLVSTFPGGGGDENNLMTNFLIFLKVAYEENFKLGLEGWQPIDTTNTDFYINFKKHFDQATSSPYASAIAKINNKPIMWFVFWSRWDTISNLTKNLLNAREAFWVIGGDLSISELNSINLNNGAEKTQLVPYAYPTASGCAFHSITISDGLNYTRNNGYVAISHGFPGFNEVMMSHDPGRNPPRYCPRNNGQMIGNFFQESSKGSADYVFLESWNDFDEYTQFEPGLDVIAWRNVGQEAIYNGDPYAQLKLIANFKAVTFVAPTLDCAIVDPVLRQQGVVQCGTPIATPPNAPSALALN